MRPVESRQAVEWLAPVDRRGAEVGNTTGYFADLWPAEGWVLHAMYENPDLPADLTHDDVHRLELETGVSEPAVVGNVNLDDVTTVIGGGKGKSSAPPSTWRRLRWDDLGRRIGHDPLTGRSPSFRSFPYRSWPIQICPATEGSLDREQFVALVEDLVRATRRWSGTRVLLLRPHSDSKPLLGRDAVIRGATQRGERPLRRSQPGILAEQHLAGGPSVARDYRL
jgi:hypothetical protein